MLGSILQALPFLLQTAPKIQQGFQGVNLKPQKQTTSQMNKLAGQQYQLAGAQTDMNSPLFQNLYQQERGAGQQDLAATIAELSRQNRKLTTMGRSPLLDRERGGESIFRNLIMGQEDVGNQARHNTFDQLLQGQNALSGAQGAYGNLYNAQSGMANKQFNNQTQQVGGYHNLGSMLQELFGLGQRQPETINWNQPSTPNNWVSYR